MFEVSCFIEVVVVELWIVDCASLVEVAAKFGSLSWRVLIRI